MAYDILPNGLHVIIACTIGEINHTVFEIDTIARQLIIDIPELLAGEYSILNTSSEKKSEILTVECFN